MREGEWISYLRAFPGLPTWKSQGHASSQSMRHGLHPREEPQSLTMSRRIANFPKWKNMNFLNSETSRLDIPEMSMQLTIAVHNFFPLVSEKLLSNQRCIT